MRHTGILVAMLLLTLSAFVPDTARSDDKADLEATMTVLDDPSDLDDSIRRMEALDDSDVGDEGPNDDSAANDNGERHAASNDGFEYEEGFDVDDLEDEDDFEEGEDVDEDRFDE
ncbi:MAG: hypothetical protein KJP08_11255 [Gammaproteobacteria bacterium]|nr:hypothetical protein [Gammaproteobacteria bacterium]